MGREGNGGIRADTLESSQAAGLCGAEGRSGSWLIGEAAGERAGGITEAELAKNRDLVQLRSDVFMNGMRELQGRVSGPAAPLPLVPEIKH